MKNRPAYFWIVIVMLLLATALSFLDRQVLSISIIKIKDDLGITDIQYGFINSGFLLSYALMFTLGGILIDRYGSRAGLGVSVAFWSLATSLHGLANSALHFGFFRFLLGIGEGGCFPGAAKAVIEWAPQNRRAVANGIAIGGSAIGSVIALPMCAWLLGFTSWRWVFVGSGVLGMIWFAVWCIVTRRKKMQRYGQVRQSVGEKTKFSWKDILGAAKTKEARVFIIMRLLLDPIFYFYMFWIPKYLSDARGMDIENIGYVTWIPFLALGVANVMGGWFSDMAYSRSRSINYSRKLVMGIGALMTLPVLFIGAIPSVSLIIAVMAVAFFAHGLWITNYITSISDVFGKKATSTIVGLSGTAGALSSLLINPLTGYIAVCSYTPMWIYAGIMYPVAFLIMIKFIPKLQPLAGH